MAKNEYYLNYEICSPLEIRRRYLERMELHIAQTENPREDRQIGEPHWAHLEAFVAGLKESETVISHLDLNLWPRDLHVLFGFILVGDIAIRGNFPDMMPGAIEKRPIHHRRVYVFESAPRGEKSAGEDFRLFFAGKTHIGWLEAIPFLVAVTALLAAGFGWFFLMQQFLMPWVQRVLDQARAYPLITNLVLWLAPITAIGLPLFRHVRRWIRKIL
jgi:hypothetical protein